MGSTSRAGNTHMICEGFAVGAVLAALIPLCAARADEISLFASEDGTITFTSPTRFFGPSPETPAIDAMDCYYRDTQIQMCGDYAFVSISVTALLGTSPFVANIQLPAGVNIAELDGTVEWTAVEGYRASLELIGTFTGACRFSTRARCSPRSLPRIFQRAPSIR